jgi:hypothetical protein
MPRKIHRLLLSLAIAAAPFFSHAEESTWDHIKQSGELRIGVAQGNRGILKIQPPVSGTALAIT